MPVVASSAVDRVDYTPSSRALDVWYRGGGQYRYLDVPQTLYEELLAAPSIGAFVNQRIKPNFGFLEMSGRRRFQLHDDLESK